MLKTLANTVLAAAIVTAATMSAQAADIIYEPPIYERPTPVVTFGGWYLRGHIGVSNQRYRGLDSPDLQTVIGNPAFDFRWLDRGRFSAAPILGVGAGYQFNDWLRADVTGEYRAPSDFTALDTWMRGPDDPVVNHYTGRKSELLFLANAYVDLGRYYGVTPYLGAGVGASRNTISRFRDFAPNAPETSTAATHSQWQFAWALHAGLGVDLTDQATLDVGYSFTHLGNARTGAVTTPNPAFPLEPFEFRRLHSHDIKVGLRYRFN